jgi:N-acetylmuramoyl-L-alanine amidase
VKSDLRLARGGGTKDQSFLIVLSRRKISGFLLVVAGLLFLTWWPARRLHSENFVFYLPNQRRLIPVWTSGNTPYLPILQVLELTGQVGKIAQKRSSVEIFVGGLPVKLRRNQTKIQVGNYAITLQEPVLKANGQWLAPTTFLSVVLPSLLGQQIVYQPGTDRAFLGGVRPVSFSVRLQNLPSGVRLIVAFTGPVSIETAATNGQWLILLGGTPIEPLEQDFFFQNPYLTKVRFDDQDGRPKLILTPSMTGLNFYPRLTDGGETLVADVVNPSGPLGITPGRKAPPVTVPAPPAAPQVKPPTPPAASPAPLLPAVVLDAGHGGTDAGARSQDGILEKNIAAQLAGSAEAALSITKEYRIVLTRAGDSDPDFEQRTITANTAHPIAFLSFHAGDLGNRTAVVAIYTYFPPSLPAGGDPISSTTLFVPWDWAQVTEQARSKALAQDLQKQFSQISGFKAVEVLSAPVRQLRSIDAPAAAIEVGTLTPTQDAGELTQLNFQKQVANAIVAALEEFAASEGKL